jgi:hypothetical protein
MIGMAALSGSDRLADVSRKLSAAGVNVEALRAGLANLAAPALESAAAPAAAPALDGRIALIAALRGSFLPADLGVAAPYERRDPDLEAVLAQSEVVTIGSERAWQLKPAARREILTRARNDLLDAIKAFDGRYLLNTRLLGLCVKLQDAVGTLESVADSRDREGRLLRDVLAGNVPDLNSLPIEELNRLVTVADWLAGTNLGALPSPAELRRALYQRELLDPFRQLVGRSVMAGADPAQDRVVGREDEIERLRAYVGIVPADQLRQMLRRNLSNVWATLTRSDAANEPLLIQGIGGIGKSTLIAKFVLDHALVPGVRLPFVYLDFDRATLAPRQPLQLLIEIALQLEAWFPEIETPLRAFRADMRKAIDGHARDEIRRRREETTRSELKACCHNLRQIVEGFNDGRAPVVVLLDTFEVVQYDAVAVDSVTALITALADRGGQEPWSNLRIVVAGRAEMPRIKTSHDPIKLPPLSIPATQTLLTRRNKGENLGLTADQIASLAGPLSNSPLDVAITVKWLKSFEPNERAALVKNIVAEARSAEASADSNRTGPLPAQRVTGILVNRMIGHIRDKEVRKLANPGLVVRAVTPKVIREVMAPASGLVASSDELPAGAEDELFTRLARESWLVEVRGSVIWHRADVRQAMLSLMRAQDEQQFEATNKRAVDHFLSHAGDRVARAEAIYHLLLAGNPDFVQVDRLWSDDLVPLLSGAVDDFTGQSRTYLTVRLGRSVPLELLRSLPPASLTSILLAQGRRVLEQYPPEAVAMLFESSNADREQPNLIGVRLEALYRTGRWTDMAELVFSAGRSEPPTPLSKVIEALQAGRFEIVRATDEIAGHPARFLLRWATRDVRADESLSRIRSGFFRWATALAESLSSSETFWDFATFVCAMARRIGDAEAESAVLRIAAKLCQDLKALPAGANDGGALRVLALFDRLPDHPILRRVDFASHFATISAAELTMLNELIRRDPEVGSRLVERALLLLDMVGKVSETVVITDPALTREFAELVAQLVDSGAARAADTVRAILMLSHPDWIEPLGAALTRAFHGDVPRRLGWWSSIERHLGSSGHQRRLSADSDGKEILSLADEAGSLRDAVSAYRAQLKSEADPAARDFIMLTESFSRWGELLEQTPGVRPAVM